MAAGGATLAEVAEKVKEDEETKTSVEEPRESAESPVEPRKSTETPVGPREPLVEAPVVVPVVVAMEAQHEAPHEAPREAPAEESKEKTAGRGMLGRITSKLKRRGDEDKQAEAPQKTVQEPERNIGTEEEPVAPIDEDEEKTDEGATAAAVAMIGTGVPTAGSVEEEHTPAVTDFAAREQAARDYETDEDDRGRQDPAATAAGVAALGAVVAAGAVEMDRAKREEEDESSEISSLSTTEDEMDDDHDELEGITSTEHTGAYNFAMPSPGVGKKPDLMRHISTIESSSSSEAGSPELTETDEEENIGRLEPRPTMIEETWVPAPVHRVEEETSRDGPLVVGTSEAVSPEDRPEDKLQAPESPVSPIGPDDEVITHGNIVIVDTKENRENREAAPLVVETSSSPPETPVTPSSAAPAPVVKTGPSNEEAKSTSTPEKEKDEKGGIRGFFKKLKGKSKAENKLTKERKSSPSTSERSFQGGAKYTETKAKDDMTTPVATTAAGQETQSQPAVHMGTDGPIGDRHLVSGQEGDPRAASPSSFERYGEESKDLNDVSSSGADEDDVSRGRTGRTRLTKDKGKSRAYEEDLARQTTTTSNGDEQFEEARDHFDESLAPPPAFGGQPKTGSPVRETRFQEQL